MYLFGTTQPKPLTIMPMVVQILQQLQTWSSKKISRLLIQALWHHRKRGLSSSVGTQKQMEKERAIYLRMSFNSTILQEVVWSFLQSGLLILRLIKWLWPLIQMEEMVVLSIQNIVRIKLSTFVIKDTTVRDIIWLDGPQTKHQRLVSIRQGKNSRLITWPCMRSGRKN